MTRAFGKIYQDDGDSTAYLDGHYSNVIIEAAPLEKERFLYTNRNMQLENLYINIV